MQCDIFYRIKLVSYGFVLCYYQLTFDLLKGDDDNNEVIQVCMLVTTFMMFFFFLSEFTWVPAADHFFNEVKKDNQNF